jgi:NTE family protein
MPAIPSTELRSRIGDDKTPARKPTVALALGAGGAKGLAHIGAIEELEAQGFEIVAIAGCSMGALIGGIRAAGKLAIYRDWVCSLDKFDVLKLVDWSFSFAGGGLIKGEKIIGAMLDLVGDVRIEDLPITFTAVATDLEREREVWLTRGSLFDAVRASIAIPTLFRPHLINGRLLVDGALLNPVPVTPLIREPADYVIAISIDGPAETNLPVEISAGDTKPKAGIGRLLGRFLPSELRALEPGKSHEPGALELLGQSMDLMQANLSRLRLAAYQPDLLVQLARNVSSAYAFYRARELIELGREKTRVALESWRPSPR